MGGYGWQWHATWQRSGSCLQLCWLHKPDKVKECLAVLTVLNTERSTVCPPWCSAWSRRSVSLKAVGTLPEKCAASKSLQQVVILTSRHLRLHVLHPSFESGQAIWEVGNGGMWRIRSVLLEVEVMPPNRWKTIDQSLPHCRSTWKEFNLFAIHSRNWPGTQEVATAAYRIPGVVCDIVSWSEYHR